jgi:hypothetical protein
MGKTQFQDLSQVKQALQQYEQMSEGSKDLAGMGALTLLASAMIKIVEELEEHKSRHHRHE